jgi:DNA-binding CsgD family transcriptional regulator
MDNGGVRRVSSPTFVGRAEELSAFDSALARAEQADPVVLLVAGESGVGKSRLVGEFAERARGAGARVMTGDCVELGEGELPYAPLVGALRELAHDIGPEPLVELAGGAGSELGLLLPEAGDAGDGPGDDPLAQSRLFELMLSLLGRLGESAPVALVIEDLHWADRSTCDFLAYLARAARRERLVVVATYRSDELHRAHPLRPFLAELERLGRTERIGLARFSRRELVSQLTGILGEHPEPSLVEALFERSEGNAFFAEELLAASLGGNGHRMPETLRDALMLRVEALTEPAQGVLRVAAAAGRSVTHGLLAEVAGLPEEALIPALREAVAHHVLVQQQSGDSYAFRHALMREAIYEDLLPGERGALHVRLAEALARNPSLSDGGIGVAAELAHHWYRAHDVPRAFEASVEAGVEAERMRAPAEAARHYERAIELWDRVDDPEERSGTTLLELLRRAAERSFLAARADRAAALARRALGLVDAETDPVTAGLLRERLGRYLWIGGRDAEAFEEYSEAVRMLPTMSPTPERARVLAAKAQVQVLMLLGRLSESRELAREAIDLARQVGARAVEAHALTTLGTDNAALGLRGEGMVSMRQALAIEQELGSPDELQRTYTNLAEAYDQDGRVEEAAGLALEGVEWARRMGSGRAYSSFLLGEAADRYQRLGRLDLTDRLTADALQLGPSGITAGLVHLVRGELELARADPEAAEHHFDEARRFLAGAIGSMWVGPLYTDLCAIAAHRGDIAEVRRLVVRAGEQMGTSDEIGFYVVSLYLTVLTAEADAAERARALGDAEAEAEARRSGAEQLASIRGILAGKAWEGPPAPELVADEAMALAESTRLEGAPSPEAWQAAIEGYDAIAYPLRAAYARLRQAEALLEASGDRAAAAERLEEAHRAAAASGAHALRKDVEALARRGRIELGGGGETASEETPFGLTERELEVLLLVADGKTNRQIGEELFISEKTASVHVSRILAKLEVGSRGEAAAVAHRIGLTRA